DRPPAAGRRAQRARGALRGAARGARARPLSRDAVRRDRRRARHLGRRRQDPNFSSGRNAQESFFRRSCLMECRQLTEWTVDRLTGALAPADAAAFADHLTGCPACRAEAESVEAAWASLGTDPGLVASPEFLRRGHDLVEDEMLRLRVRAF